MLASELLTRAATVLQDESHVRWPLPELVNWINDGQQAIVLAKPSANSQSVVLSLTIGTLQTLTDNGHLMLLRLPRNLTSAGPPRVGGRAIRAVDREVLDASEPNWHDRATIPFKREVRQYVFDEENPREFYVYPGNDGTGLVEAVVATLPEKLVANGNETLIASYGTALSLDDPYGLVVLDYVLSRAFAKDDVGADLTRAGLHMQAFMTALGIKVQSDAAKSPNVRAKVTGT